MLSTMLIFFPCWTFVNWSTISLKLGLLSGNSSQHRLISCFTWYGQCCSVMVGLQLGYFFWNNNHSESIFWAANLVKVGITGLTLVFVCVYKRKLIVQAGFLTKSLLVKGFKYEKLLRCPKITIRRNHVFKSYNNWKLTRSNVLTLTDRIQFG